MAEDAALWKALVDAEGELIQARRAFLTGSEDRIGVLRKALDKASERRTALALMQFLPTEERQELFPDLVGLASETIADLDVTRDAIFALPREWVLANIEEIVSPRLDQGGHEEYHAYLELYSDLDRDLTRRLAERAARHEDEEIRQTGARFLKKLDAVTPRDS